MEQNLEPIRNKIYEIRGQRVMLDRDLAELYGVTTGNLNKAVKRNIRRFPPDFIFQLTKEEFYELQRNLIFQNGISSWGGTRKLPYAFTQAGHGGVTCRSERHQRVNTCPVGCHQRGTGGTAAQRSEASQAYRIYTGGVKTEYWGLKFRMLFFLP